MLTIKKFFNFIDSLFLSVWGITVLDLLPIIDTNILESVDNTIKSVMVVLGLIYYVIVIYFKIQNKIIDKKMNEVELEKKMFEFEKSKSKK